MADDNKFGWNQFCRLGEMIGDGLHHDEPWITKEYKVLAKKLMPEEFKEQRKIQNKKRNESIAEKVKKDKCRKCDGELLQTRSGSLTVKCTKCGAMYKYKVVKKK